MENQPQPFERWLKFAPAIFEKTGDAPKEKTESAKEMKNYAFRAIILNRLLRDAENDMRSAGMTEEQVGEVENFLGGMGMEAGEAFLSVPAEIREKRYADIVKNIEMGSDMEKELAKLMEETMGKKISLGYHITDADIPKSGPANNWNWSINGYEYDHRDNLSMAYYSLDHDNLFYKRKGKYVYVVRADLGKDTSHRLDENNRWGRAPRLSIIDRFDIAEIDGEVDEAMEELKRPEDDSSGRRPVS